MHTFVTAFAASLPDRLHEDEESRLEISGPHRRYTIHRLDICSTCEREKGVENRASFLC
jgi:hypothetical protein